MRRSLFVFLLVACTPPASDPGDAAVLSDAPSIDASSPTGYTFETLDEQTLTVVSTSIRVELVRATRPEGAHTYLQYAHAIVPTNAPLVVVNQPYSGIDWTGEAVDARWAAEGSGLRADVDAPDYDGDDVTSYAPVTVQQAADDCVAWLINGFACVQVYARFYAGGTLVDDALDSATGYHFALSRASELDLTRLAGWGGSWGGMMTLEGAARAPEGARPRTIVALSPPSDFADLARWTDTDLPAVYPTPVNVEAFFSPYWRRSAPDIGRTPIAEPRSLLFRPDGLCPVLPADTWLLHDEWDTLIPVRQSEALAAACPDRVHAIFWRRQTPTDFASIGLDHGAFGHEPMFPTAYTFAMSQIVSALVASTATTWIAIAYEPALVSFLGTVHDEQMAGGDIGYALAPMRTLTDARSSLFDPTDGTFHPGPDVVAAAVNEVWGTTFDGPGVRAQLATGFPGL